MQEKSCPCQRNLETFQNMRRGGRPCPPLKSYEFAEDFHKNGIFCGRTEASAPTVLWRIFRKVRRGRCPHRPGKMRRFAEISGESVTSLGAMWASPPTQGCGMQCAHAPPTHGLKDAKNADSRILPASWLFCFQPVTQTLGIEKAQGLWLEGNVEEVCVERFAVDVYDRGRIAPDGQLRAALVADEARLVGVFSLLVFADDCRDLQ